MSTTIAHATEKIPEKYIPNVSIEAIRFCGGHKSGLMCQFIIGEDSTGHVQIISLTKKQAIDFCARVIIGLNEVG